MLSSAVHFVDFSLLGDVEQVGKVSYPEEKFDGNNSFWSNQRNWTHINEKDFPHQNKPRIGKLIISRV